MILEGQKEHFKISTVSLFPNVFFFFKNFISKSCSYSEFSYGIIIAAVLSSKCKILQTPLHHDRLCSIPHMFEDDQRYSISSSTKVFAIPQVRFTTKDARAFIWENISSFLLTNCLSYTSHFALTTTTNVCEGPSGTH